MMENPLLQTAVLPDFSKIQAEHLEPALDAVLALNRNLLRKALEENTVYTWENLMSPLELMDTGLSEVWAPISHLNSVAPVENMPEIYNSCLAKLSGYVMEIGQNTRLYQAMAALLNNKQEHNLNNTQIRVLENYLNVFCVSGIHLPEAKRARLNELQQALAELENQFEQNACNATHNWQLTIENSSDLTGLSAETIALAAQKAHDAGGAGYRLGLEESFYLSVMRSAKSRELRKTLYHAYSTRASSIGPQAGLYDNTPIMEQILHLRSQIAGLLGYDNFAQRALSMKMLKEPNTVLQFLTDLAHETLPAALKELTALQDFAREQDGVTKIEAWDIEYYSEKLRTKLYSFDEESLRYYFPVNKVLSGLFDLAHKLFAINIKEVSDPAVWHPDVRLFEVYGQDQSLRGYFYLDLYSRPYKRDTSWMEQYRTRCRGQEGNWNTPVVFLTCNFRSNVQNQSPLLSHEDLRYLFHEFGHTLHHLLTRVDYAGVSGINGVASDALEIPSLFMENWVWEQQVIAEVSAHYETGAPLPRTITANLKAAKVFNAAIQLIERIRLALVDMRLHTEYSKENAGSINKILEDVDRNFSELPLCADNRFLNSFSLIFSYGYAASYYGYLWAEALASDIFAKFENEGLFNTKIGADFLALFLETGGSCDLMEQFVKFRGRKPAIEALLQHRGIREKIE